MEEQIYHNGLQSKLLIRHDDKTGQMMLVKTTETSDPSNLANMKLFNEFEILKDQDIKGVRKVFTIKQNGSAPELLLEFIEGSTITKFFEEGHHSLSEFLTIAIEIAEALEGLHQARIIHKDINPENILVKKEDLSIRLIDFGISTKMDLRLEHLCNPEKLHGTLRYISPEQTGRMDRVIDNRSDLYSLGVTFYELLTGHLPFEGDTPLELVHAHLTQMPPPLSLFPLNIDGGHGDVPGMLSDIVMLLTCQGPAVPV